MKLRRAWPAICIWGIFLIFEIVMVASSSFFLGLFPSEYALIYSGVFTVLSILVMNIITFMLGKLCDRLEVSKLSLSRSARVVYFVIILALITAGVVYRVYLLGNTTAEPTGKLSLYENAMVGAAGAAEEYDLLSLMYIYVLKFILLFTGNYMSVAFFFEIACFTVFTVCGFFTVKKLLGMAAGVVFTAYVSFMPIFLRDYSGAVLSTDSFFMALFGIELLLVALFLRGAYMSRYKSPLWIVWFLILGAAVGFMAYVDAGTVIMILPFLLSALFLHKKEIKLELLRLLFVVIGAAASFMGMIIQEAGADMIDVTFSNWSNYYFHNLNTIDMFWTYTDYKIIYLVTVIAMSGIIVGFWKNRTIEKISPWLLSMIFIFVTVPFMGATRMNTQVFVSVYYAFILGCVASLITMPASEGTQEIEQYEMDEDFEESVSEEEKETAQSGVSEVVEPEEGFENKMIKDEAKDMEEAGAPDKEPEQELSSESAPEPTPEPEPEPTPAPEPTPEPAPEPAPGPEPEPAPAKSAEPKNRFVPEGMVLPEDDEDMDSTPHMKMPEYKKVVGLKGKNDKLKVSRSSQGKTQKDDFDIDFKPGDDFDI